jgi:hypothetical protein
MTNWLLVEILRWTAARVCHDLRHKRADTLA